MLSVPPWFGDRRVEDAAIPPGEGDDASAFRFAVGSLGGGLLRLLLFFGGRGLSLLLLDLLFGLLLSLLLLHRLLLGLLLLRLLRRLLLLVLLLATCALPLIVVIVVAPQPTRASPAAPTPARAEARKSDRRDILPRRIRCQ